MYSMLIQSYHWKSRFKQDNHKIKHLLYHFLTMQICEVVVLLITLHKYYSLHSIFLVILVSTSLIFVKIQILNMTMFLYHDYGKKRTSHLIVMWVPVAYERLQHLWDYNLLLYN